MTPLDSAPNPRTGERWPAPGAEIVRGKHVHFMGIGGIGVSALAHLARAAGAVVSGCDAKLNDIASTFAREGCRILRGHSPDHLEGVDILVRSSAVRPAEPELAAAEGRGIPVFDRLPMMLRIAEGMKLMGVAGSHGKTTTTALATAVLMEGGLDPSCAIGGMVDAIGDTAAANARAGRGEWFVAEIDESDGYISDAACHVAILTNVDREHMDHYTNLAGIRLAFGAFLANVPAGGLVVACADDAEALTLARASGKRLVTFGLSGSADFHADGLALKAEGSCFDAITPSCSFKRLRLSRPGIHNVQNAMGIVAAAAELGVAEAAIRRAFGHAPKVGRRWEEYRLSGGVRMIVDYAHHPAEIAATVAAARLGAPGRLVAVFQPHRYTRTRDLGEEFGPAFADVDELIVMPIYAASEDPLPGVTAEVTTKSARRAGVNSARSVGSREEALDALKEVARGLGEGDALLVLGAGDVDALGRELLCPPGAGLANIPGVAPETFR